MIQALKINGGGVVAFRVVGKVTNKDMKEAAEKIDQLLKEENRLKMYVELDDFDGYEPKAFFKDLSLSIKHFKNFEKIAIVSQETWADVLTEITDKILLPVKARHYSINERPQALRWIKEGD